MFTGIVETVAVIAAIEHDGSNIHFVIESSITGELKVDQSVAHNGVCLTTIETSGRQYKVTAVAETIAKTNLDTWRVGDKVNLERAMKIGDRLDGHFVQGHVDATATCIEKQELQGSWLYSFKFSPEYGALVIEKGSICIDGVSLTVFDIKKDQFTVTIIPYTYNHTNFSSIEAGSTVNVEFDVLGKYLLRNLELKKL
jgi:riboflavin synthase